jgi:catechol 2,3-dioxygenase-like lactoylglutathione lyase family enzyme
MLGASDLVGFVPTTDLDRAAAFYGGVLGLEPLDTSPVATTFDAHGTVLRVTLVDHLSPAPFTVLGWTVTGMDEIVRSLGARGVAFERFAGMDQDELGIWTTPGGDRVAWFKDPDGNVLSVTELASGAAEPGAAGGR